MRGLLATAALLIAVAPAWALGKPRLVVVSPAPKMVVRGLSFKSHEHVTVRLIGRTTTTAAVSASVTGAFRVSLVKPRPLACGRLVLRAAGSLGSLVLIRLGPPECNPAGDLNR
jgi:hypothetical protein